MFDDIRAVALEEIRAAHARLSGLAMCSPLVPFEYAHGQCSVMLKLECLQPIGSFKVRPVGSAVLARPEADLGRGIYTASSGNSALAVAWMARQLGIPATAVLHENAPTSKVAGLQRLGAEIRTLPFDEWWTVIETGGLDGMEGLYVDAVRDPNALSGDGTVGIEIAEAAPDIDAVFVPFGGGGLACGIACAVRALIPGVKIVVCELDTAAPFAAARKANKPVRVDAQAGFITGVGYDSVLPEMWPLASNMVDDVLSVSLGEVSEAIRLITERNHVIAEGAGAIPLAAALFADHSYRRVCAVVSGGNLESAVLTSILASREQRLR